MPEATPRDPNIRAVSRALELLRVMNQRQRWSLHTLHQETGLPKPTLFRLLHTLQDDGYVSSDVIRREYSLTRRVLELSQGFTEPSRLVSCAASLIRDITRSIQWPLALGVLEGEHLVVAYSTMPYSPLAIRTSTIGRKLHWQITAMAQVYLAFQPPENQRALLSANEPTWGQTHEDQIFEQELQLLRRAGYAVRYGRQRGDSSTLAVPVLDNDRAIAALGMTTYAGSLNTDLIKGHLSTLQETARLIVERYHDPSQS